MPDTQAWFVNVYMVDRAYGGPEEGGWWLDVGEILAVYPVKTKAVAKKLRTYLETREEYSNEGRRDISSVLSEGQYRVYIETEPGANFPQGPVYYE